MAPPGHATGTHEALRDGLRGPFCVRSGSNRLRADIRGSSALNHLLLIGALLLPLAAFTQASIRETLLRSFSLDFGALFSRTGVDESAPREHSELSPLDGLTGPPQELLQLANGPGSPGPPGSSPPGPPMKPPEPEAPLPNGPNIFIPWLEEPYFVIDGERWPVSFLENGQVVPGIKIIKKKIRFPPKRKPIDLPLGRGVHRVRERIFLWDDADISVTTEGGPFLALGDFATRFKVYPESDAATEPRLEREGYEFDMEDFILSSELYPGNALNLSGNKVTEFHPDGIDDNVVLIVVNDGEEVQYYRFDLHEGLDTEHPPDERFDPTEHGPPTTLEKNYPITTEIEAEARELLEDAGYRFDHDRHFFANSDHDDDPLNFWGRQDVAYFTDPSDESKILIRTVGNNGTTDHYRFDPATGERTETDGVLVAAAPKLRSSVLSAGPWRLEGNQLLHDSRDPALTINLQGREDVGFNEHVSFYEFPNPSPDYPGHVEGEQTAALVRVVEQDGDVVFYRFDQDDNITNFTLEPHVSEEAQEVMDAHGWSFDGAKLVRNEPVGDTSSERQELGFGPEPVVISVRKSQIDGDLFVEAIQANGHRWHDRISPEIGSRASFPADYLLTPE